MEKRIGKLRASNFTSDDELLLNLPVCPCRMATGAHDLRHQTRTVLSQDPVASSVFS